MKLMSLYMYKTAHRVSSKESLHQTLSLTGTGVQLTRSTFGQTLSLTGTGVQLTRSTIGQTLSLTGTGV